MNVASVNPDPRALVFFEMFSFLALAIAAGVALHRLIGRFFEESDPRRRLIAQVLLYAAAFVRIAVSIWARHRGQERKKWDRLSPKRCEVHWSPC